RRVLFRSQVETVIVAFALEETMRLDLDRHDRVAGAAGSFLALAGKAHLGAGFEPGRKLQVDRLAVAQRDALCRQRGRILEAHGEAIGDVRALGRRPAAEIAKASGEAPAAPPRAHAAEQPFENVAKAARFAAAAEIGAETALAAAAHARAEAAERIHGIAVAIDLAAIETGALVLVGQQVIGLGDLAELLRR